MRPEQAFAGRTVVKTSGHGKNKRGVVCEVNMRSGMILVILNGETTPRVCNPQEWENIPPEKSGIASTDETE